LHCIPRTHNPTMRMPKVLLVDPNPETRASLAKALADGGYDAVTAPDGASAVGMLETERPDLVMSHAHVQDMDGHELFTMVRKDVTTMDTPFLLLAGRNRPVALAAAEAGVEVIVTGEFRPATVVARVRDLLQSPAQTDAPSGLRGRNETARPVVSARTARELTGRGGLAGAGAFHGSFDVMDLAEVTQALSLGGKTGRLSVSLAAGEGAVAFDNGRIVHATFAGRTGASAFAAIMVAAQRESAARFRFSRAGRAEVAEGPRTISCSVEQLLLSIAVELDESDLGPVSLDDASRPENTPCKR